MPEAACFKERMWCDARPQDPKYGYGAAGNFSFPAVPPSSSLTYEVEMVGFEEPQQPDESVSFDVMKPITVEDLYYQK